MRKYSCIIALLVAGFTCSAQTFNPTVVVENDYEGKTMETNKQSVPMNVPDSLTRFDLDFDYSVFDNPYEGSYEFVPYMLDMRPEAKTYSGHPFYLSVGAGYKFHPEADLAFSPHLDKLDRLHIGFRDTFRGYYGPYVGTGFNYNGADDVYELVRGDKFQGIDLKNEAGFDARYDFDKFALFLNVGYRSIVTRDTLENHIYDALDIAVGAASRPGGRFDYNVLAGMTYANDYIVWPSENLENVFSSSEFRLNELDANLKAAAHYEIFNSIRVGGEFGADYVMAGMTVSNHALDMHFTPQLLWNFKRYHLKAGLKLAFLFAEDEPVNTEYLNFQQKSGRLFPDVEFSYSIIDKKLDAYVSVTGGDHLNSYSDLIEHSHFFNPSHMKLLSPIMENSVERFNGSVGIRTGFNCFQADVKAGFVEYESGRFDALYVTSYTRPISRNSFAYLNYDQKYVQADLRWNSDMLQVDLSGKFQDTAVKNDGQPYCAILPSRFMAEGAVTYNLNHRLFVGVTADFASERTGYLNYSILSIKEKSAPQAVSIPGYIDLGANVRFDFNSVFGAWLKVDNILNDNVQRVLGRAYDGIWFTAGIRLTL